MNSRDQIDAYLGNELSDAERTAFENELQSNPDLQQELTFQQEVIDGIKEARKADLKAMLNNVPVGGTGFEFSGSTMQYIGIALITIIVGSGIIYFWPTEDTPEPTEVTEAIEPTETDISTTEEIPSTQPEEKTEEIVEEVQDTPPPTVPTEEEVTTPQNSEEPEEEVVEEAVEETPISTEDARPVVIDGFDTEDGSEHDIPENNLGKANYNASSVEVEINSGVKKYDFHYQFVNSKLVLYGDFNETYEIMDLIKNQKRAVYLFYKDQYFQLKLNQSEIQELNAITDASAIRELKQIRDNK